MESSPHNRARGDSQRFQPILRLESNLDTNGDSGNHISHNGTGPQIGEGDSAHKEENRVADSVNEEAEDDAFNANGSKPVLKPKLKKQSNSVTFDDEDMGETNQDEAHDNDPKSDSGKIGYAGVRPRRSSKRVIMPTVKEEVVSSSTTQQEHNRNAQGQNIARRGRPPKRLNGAGSLGTSSGSRIKRKGVELEDGNGRPLRRSTRAAAESAKEQITQQTKSPRVASTPSTPGKKAAARAASKTPTKSRPKTPAKAEYEVELILDTRKKSGTTEYLVKWKGYHVSQNSWEPAVNLTHCAEKLREFRSGKKK